MRLGRGVVLLLAGAVSCSEPSSAAPTDDASTSDGDVVVECVQSTAGFTCSNPIDVVSTECSADDVTEWLALSCAKPPCGGASTACQKCLGDWTHAPAGGGAPELNLEACLRRFVPALRDCAEAQSCLDGCIAKACETCPNDVSRAACADGAKTNGCKGRAQSLVLFECESRLAERTFCKPGDLPRVLALACEPTSPDAGGDSPIEDTTSVDSAPVDMGVPGTVKLSGMVKGIGGESVVGATVTTLEDSTIKTTSDSMGLYSLSLPTKVPLTITVTAVGRARTIEQTAKFSGAATLDPIMVTTAELMAIQGAGGAPSGTAMLYVIAYSKSPCDADHATVSILPSAGKVVYGGSDGMPSDGTSMLLTSKPAAFITGVPTTSTVELVVTPRSGCKMQPWPLDTGALELLAPVKLLPDAFLDVSVFIGP